jgi:hypothetical protein
MSAGVGVKGSHGLVGNPDCGQDCGSRGDGSHNRLYELEVGGDSRDIGGYPIKDFRDVILDDGHLLLYFEDDSDNVAFEGSEEVFDFGEEGHGRGSSSVGFVSFIVA